MDINTLRIIVTVLSFAVFCGIVVWAWSRHQQAAFTEAANQLIADNDQPISSPAVKGESA